MHVSSLENFGSIMIYMFQGIHRLQIYSNWIYRTKVMNFMVFISHFAILFFTSKLCTGILWFLCKILFYTFSGFQGYYICNIWPSIWFYIDFTICSRNWYLKIEIEFCLTGLTGGADEDCDVASPYRSVPIRLDAFNLSHRKSIEGTQREGRRWAHRRDRLQRERH
jgi:hypothetical protein